MSEKDFYYRLCFNNNSDNSNGDNNNDNDNGSNVKARSDIFLSWTSKNKKAIRLRRFTLLAQVLTS